MLQWRVTCKQIDYVRKKHHRALISGCSVSANERTEIQFSPKASLYISHLIMANKITNFSSTTYVAKEQSSITLGLAEITTYTEVMRVKPLYPCLSTPRPPSKPARQPVAAEGLLCVFVETVTGLGSKENTHSGLDSS